MSTLRVTGLKQETSSATNISLAVGGGVTVAGISTFYNNTIFTNDVTVTGNISVGGTLTYQDVTDVDSIGIITARSGIDVGTGTSISSPSSNTLTLGTNNEERLRIDSAGNFGIGTSSVGSLLHVSGTSSTAFDETNFDSADYNFLKIENTTDSKSAGIRFQIGSNGEAAITATEVSDGACDIVFQNRGGGIRSEKMRLDSSGKLLVGTDTNSVDDSLFTLKGIQTYQSSSSTYKHVKIPKYIQSSSTSVQLISIEVPASELFYLIEATIIGSRAVVGNVGTSQASKRHFMVSRDGSGSNVVLDSNVNSLNYEVTSSSAGGTVNKQTMGATLQRAGTEANTDTQVIEIVLNSRSGSVSTGRVFAMIDIWVIGSIGTIS